MAGCDLFGACRALIWSRDSTKLPPSHDPSFHITQSDSHSPVLTVYFTEVSCAKVPVSDSPTGLDSIRLRPTVCRLSGPSLPWVGYLLRCLSIASPLAAEPVISNIEID